MKNPGLYILTSPSGKQYVGKDRNLPTRAKIHFSGNAPQCRHIHRAIKKYGADVFDVEIIRYPGISHEALNAVERWKIGHLQTLAPKGYNLTEGGEGVKASEETRQKLRKNNSKRVTDGTHHFLDSELQQRTAQKRVADGTHPLLGKNNPAHKQIADGTHPFLDSEFQRRTSRRTQRKRIEDGTHNFLDSEFQREVQHKRIEDGTHNFLGGEIQRRTNNKRVAEGTHPFLGGEIARRTQKKRIEEGTHHFLGESHPMKRLSKDGRHPSTLKRLKAEWCYIIAVSRFWYEIHEYTLKRRAEFLSKDIPDTSNAEQINLF